MDSESKYISAIILRPEMLKLDIEARIDYLIMRAREAWKI